MLLQGPFKYGSYQFHTSYLKLSNPTNLNNSCLNRSYSFISPNKLFEFIIVELSNNSDLCVNKVDVFVWHKRLGHPCEKTIKCVFSDLQFFANFNDLKFCQGFHFRKHHGGHFFVFNSEESRSLELIHSNEWGSTPVVSSIGFKYYLHFLDEHTMFTWLFPLRNKSKVTIVFK